MSARGFTLLEVFIVLAILAILTGLSVPGLGRSLQTQQGEAAIVELQRLFNFARSAAVSSGQIVTLCKSSDGLACGGAWEQGALVFLDRDGDGSFDAGDDLLKQTRFSGLGGSLTLRAFPNRAAVQFVAEGFTRAQNGSFTWCPATGEPALAQQLIFTQAGRARLARDTNGDGVREGADGKPLKCG